jgi:hypothetical protein
MPELDLNRVVGDVVNESGVQPITVGMQVCACVRENLRSLIKAADPEGYARYRAIKYPAGEGSDTPESRVEATRYLFDAARDLLAPHYLRTDGV